MSFTRPPSPGPRHLDLHIGGSSSPSPISYHSSIAPSDGVLFCEFIGYGNCDVTFALDDFDNWTEHIINDHLEQNLPKVTLCWFCDDVLFESTTTHSLHMTFRDRMWHIHEHFLNEEKTTEDMRPDHYMNGHLYKCGVITEPVYNYVRQWSETDLPHTASVRRSHAILADESLTAFQRPFVDSTIEGSWLKARIEHWITDVAEHFARFDTNAYPPATTADNHRSILESRRSSLRSSLEYTAAKLDKFLMIINPEPYSVFFNTEHASLPEEEQIFELLKTNYDETEEEEFRQAAFDQCSRESSIVSSEDEGSRPEAFEHTSEAKLIATEQLAFSNPEFGSDYESLSRTKEKLCFVDETGSSTDQESLCAEQESVQDRTEKYAHYFGAEVVTKLKHELKGVDWTGFRMTLSDLLKEFAIRMGNEGETQIHRDLMYWTHKGHDDIVRYIRKQQLLRDRTSLLFNREDQNCSQDTVPLANYEPLPAIEIESYQQIISQSRAFEWLVSSIRNSVELGMTGGDNSMVLVKRQILSELKLLDQSLGRPGTRISRRRDPIQYRIIFTLGWPSARVYQEESFKALSDVFERVLTFTGGTKWTQALLCEDYVNQTWPTTGPRLIQSILKALGRDKERKGNGQISQNQDLIEIELSEETMQVYGHGSSFELAEIGTQLAWLACALIPEPKLNEGIISRPSVRCGRLSMGKGKQHRLGTQDIFCHFEVESTIVNLDDISGRNGNCWRAAMNNFVIAEGFPIRSRLGGNPGLEMPLDIAADFIGSRKVTRFKGRPLIKGFSAMLCPIMSENGIIYWHVFQNKVGRMSFADMRVDEMSVVEPGSLTLRDLEDSRHVVGWCTEVKRFAGTLDANLDIRRTDLKRPPDEWALKEIQVGGGQYINFLATFAVRKDQKALRIERDRLDYNGNMEWIAKRHVILHDTEESERRAWFIDGASALLHLVFASLWKDQRGKLRNTYKIDLQEFKQFYGDRPAGIETSLSVLMSAEFLGTRLCPRDPMNPSHWYLLRDRVDDIFDIVSQMIDHQEDTNSTSGLGKILTLSSWKQHIGWAFADIASAGEPCTLKSTTLKQHGEGWAYFAREIHAVTLFGSGFGDLLRPTTVIPDPCARCLWGSLAPKEGDILAVALEDLRSHSGPENMRRLEARCIIGQRLSEGSHHSCFRTCSNSDCTNQRIQTFYKDSGKGCDPIWQDITLPEIYDGSPSIDGAALLGVRPKALKVWRASKKNCDQQQPGHILQSQIDTDGLCITDGTSSSTPRCSNTVQRPDSIQMTAIHNSSIPGTSILSRQADLAPTKDGHKKVESPPVRVRRKRDFVRRIWKGVNDWIHSR